MGSKLVIGLASGSLEKLVTCSVITGGAVALDMDVDIYLLLQGAYAFKKEVAENNLTFYERPELKEELMAGLERNKIPSPYEYLKQLKESGNVKIHVCATAGKIWGAYELSNFSELVDDIVGIAEYVSRAEEAGVHMTL